MRTHTHTHARAQLIVAIYTPPTSCLHTRTDQLRYFHSSNNLSGRYLEEPHLITNVQDYEDFLKSIEQKDVLQYAINNRPNSSWTCQLVTNVTFFVNHTRDHPIGAPRTTLPGYIKNNKAIVSLDKDTRGVRYDDGLCIFRCLALSQGCDVRRLEASTIALHDRYNPGADVNQFQGVSLEDLVRVETAFQVNINVFKLTNTETKGVESEVVRRSLCRYPETMYLNLHENHFSYISDINKYCHSYRCRTCDSMWKTVYKLHRHERSCEATVKRVYSGGVYNFPRSIFQQLEEEGIYVDDERRYYPYRATFDFECYFDDTSGAIDVRKALIGCRRYPRMRRVYFRVNLSYRPRRSDISAIYRIRCKL